MKNMKKENLFSGFQLSKETSNGAKKLLFILTSFFLFSLFVLSLVQAQTITANVTETNMNSSVLLHGIGFSPSLTYYLIPKLENKSSQWDGFNENWFFSAISTNNTINITTNASGGFNYTLYIPYDWRVSGGKVSFEVGQNLSSALLWSKQGANWTATLPTKNGITGDNDSNGYLFTASNVAGVGLGGIEKFSKINGTLSCNYTVNTATALADISNNLSLAFAINTTSIFSVHMSNCTFFQQTVMLAAATTSYSINVAPNNLFAVVTYASGNAPRAYTISNGAPTLLPLFNRTAYAANAYDSCISPDSATVYVGYSNGNVTSVNATNGTLIWISNPILDTLNATHAFPVNSLSCDSERVYVGRGNVTVAGITNTGFIEALNVSNGSRVWVANKTDTVYDGMDVNAIRCDSSFCYAAKALTPTPYGGSIASAIFQINKSNGNVNWWNWRSALPIVFNGAYGQGTAGLGVGSVHSAIQALWVDEGRDSYIYPAYTSGWVQKIQKNDVSAEYIPTNLWIRGSTNYWNYVADVPKNIWLSNETPYYTFRQWNEQGVPLNTSDARTLAGTYFRYSMLNTFNSFTASEYNAPSATNGSVFTDPVIMTYAVGQKNSIQMFNMTAQTSCPASRYSANLTGWHYEDRSCRYEEIPAQNNSGWNIGTTINGTFISGVIYSLVKTKFWENSNITEYLGNDNWAWAAMYNTSAPYALGFATKFGSDQEDVYSDNIGRGVLFTNFASTYYYRPQFRADLNRKSDNYVFFLPKSADPNNSLGETTHWRRVDIETRKIANPILINLSSDENSSFSVGGSSYGHRINFTATEPGILNRTFEPVEISFNASGGIRSDCADVVVTDTSDSAISLWQVDNYTACSRSNNLSVWIMMNWSQGTSRSLRLYYNSSGATPQPAGVTDLVVSVDQGACSTQNQTINVSSSSWYNWTRVANGTFGTEITRFYNTSEVLWGSATHYQIATCFKNSNTTGTGAGLAADSCSPIAVPISRCLQSGKTGSIFAHLNATANIPSIQGRPSGNRTLNVEYYFFANTGRVRIRTQLNQSIDIINTTVSKNWPPYYYFSLNGLIPGTSTGLNSWVYYSGLYNQMKRPVAAYNPDQTEVNLSASPLPMVFTIKYGGLTEIPQANGTIIRPATLTDNFWGKGCTAHKIWQYYTGGGSGYLYGSSTIPIYTSEFISCSQNVSSSLPKLGQSGYVNVIPEMAWEGTSVNRYSDFSLVGKFYMMPNLYRPYNRENKFVSPYATPSSPMGLVGGSTPYSTAAKISSFIIPVCPERSYGYKGYDDFLTNLTTLIENTNMHIRNNTNNIPCAAQIIKFTDQRGSDGINILFAKNLTVIVGETISAGWNYPVNTLSSSTYSFTPNGNLDLTFAQKGNVTAGLYGKFFFTYTPNEYVFHTFVTSGNPQFTLTGTPSTSTSPTATMYTTRYQFAPDAMYTKDVFDESVLWNRDIQNFTYYRPPCWLGRLDNKFGATESGYTFATTPATPGWQHALWGTGATYSAACPHSTYNLEVQNSFRPAWSSKTPAIADAGAWNELFIDGRMNLNGTGYPLEAESDTYYVARHNALFDYKHGDDFTAILEDTSELAQNEKHPNKEPWYCQISTHNNQSFCVMTTSLSSLVYNYAPGQGLTQSQGWSPYWSSVEEASTFRKYFNNRFGETTTKNYSYDHILDVTMYPSLSNTETLMSNLLYTSGSSQDYESFFRVQFPFAASSLQQTQFLLKDWKNSAFFKFDRDSRTYSPGSQMNITGLAVYNGSALVNASFNLSIYRDTGVLIQNDQLITNMTGYFNITYILPTNMTAGLHYIEFSYNNSQFNDSVSFVMTNLIATITNDNSVYEQGDTVYTDPVEITDSLTGLVTDPDQLELRYINPSSSTIGCAKYPDTAVVSNCGDNLSRSSTGRYNFTFSLGTNPLGTYTVRATVTNGGISADYTNQFVVALIDPCTPNSVYSYALSYPLTYNNLTDLLVVAGNSSMGTAANPITTDQIYEFAAATRGTCIIEKPATGTYTVKSRLMIGNDSQQVYVLSKGESIGFTSTNMSQLTINSSGHMTFGSISNGVPQEGSNIKFTSNLSNDILLDVSGGELVLYDSYVTDAGSNWGRFIFRGACGNTTQSTYSAANSSVTIKKTIFDRATRGQFFYTSNVTIDDMKINRINSSDNVAYGLVSGCNLPTINNLQIYNQGQNGSAIYIAEEAPASNDLVVTSSTLDFNSKDVIAYENGRGVQLINTQWDRAYDFNYTGTWDGTTTIKESYGFLPTVIDSASAAINNTRLVLINRYGNVENVKITNTSGTIAEQNIPSWQTAKTSSAVTESNFNPYTLYVKSYGKAFVSEPKTFSVRTVEAKQLLPNSFISLSASAAAAVANLTYAPAIKVSYGQEANTTWTTTGQLMHYPIDQCQYFAIFANDTKLAETTNYTVDYATGALTFTNNMTGFTISPVYSYGGNITVTNGLTTSNAYTMSKVYDYISYQFSQNNLSEDLYTVDGLTYRFCVDFVIGNATNKGSISDTGATIGFNDGYDIRFDGVGGFVDLAGITSGGGSGGGLPLNIFDSVGSSYAPGNAVYIFSTILDSTGLLVDAVVNSSIYLPNGTVYLNGTMVSTSLGRFVYNFTLPSDATLGTWRVDIDAAYQGSEVHDNLAFVVSVDGSSGGGSGISPTIQIDAPSSINTNTNFGINAFVRNNNSQLVNCDGNASLTLKDNINGTLILNATPMSNGGSGQYNYTTSLAYHSTFLAFVSCSINGANYTSNPKVISSQDVSSSGGGSYPTIELSASTPIATSSTASIGALVRSSSGVVTNCDSSLGITIRNLANGTSFSGSMTSFGTGLYNYSWDTPSTPSVYYVNASCSISSTSYTGFTLLSTQSVSSNSTIDYNQIALYVWNYTSRNLTYYNQSVAENIQNCLKDSQCSTWWINTTFATIQNTIQSINSTVSQINTTVNSLIGYLNCTSPNEICTRLGNTLNNLTAIHSMVYSLNNTQIPNLQTSVNNIYTDTQYVRNNMVTAAALQEINNTIWIIKNTMVNQSMFESNLSSLMNRIQEINTTTRAILLATNCSSPANSVLCSYMENINSTVFTIQNTMATYEQVQNVSNDTQWLRNNVATSAQIASNFSDVFGRLAGMNLTLTAVRSDLNATNQSLSQLIQAAQADITWIRDNVATSAQIASNFSDVFARLSGINATVSSTQTYLSGTITDRLNGLNSTVQGTYAYLLANISTQQNITEIINRLSMVQSNLTFMINNMFYQGNATGAFLVDYLSTIYTQTGSQEELWAATRDLLGNPRAASSAYCGIYMQSTYIANASVSISSGGVYANWSVPSGASVGAYNWNCTITSSDDSINLNVPFFVASPSGGGLFNINFLTAGSPRYPNEEALIETSFSGQNGSAVTPDSINLTIYDSNDNVWASASLSSFTQGSDHIWRYANSISSNPTTGTYSAHLQASYFGVVDTRSVQFRIATGGPYKVYLNCPATATVGAELQCTVIIQDEGEAATESTTTVWIDTDSNSLLGGGEPQASFSKETQPLQNVSEIVSINIPAGHASGFFVVRGSTEYLNSGQPNSGTSDSITILGSSSTGGTTGGSTGGGSGGGSGVTGAVITPSPNVTSPSDSVVCNAPYIRYGKECCLDLDKNNVCDLDEKGEIISPTQTEGDAFQLNITMKNILWMLLILIAILITIRMSFFVTKRIKQRKQVNQLEARLEELDYLKKKKAISFESYLLRKEEALEMIHTILRSRKVIAGFAGLALIVIFISMGVNNPTIVGAVVGSSGNASLSPIFIVMAAIVIAGLILMNFGKISGFVKSLFSAGYAPNSVSGIIGKKVYTIGGMYLGKVVDVNLKGQRVDSLKIDLRNSKKYSLKGIIINYRLVKNVKKIVLVDNLILENLQRKIIKQ